MNNLTNAIVNHIFENFKINSKSENFLSLKNPNFELESKIVFDSDEGEIKNKIWGCEYILDCKSLKLILGDCGNNEYALLISYDNSPTYGLYFGEICQISFFIDKWVKCNVELQASLLIGLEKTKNALGIISKISEENTELLFSFIEYYNETENN
jgi:hypothetical protein